MRSTIGASYRGPGQGGAVVGYTKPEYGKGYKIEMLPYQTGGVLNRNLWTSKLSQLRIIPGVDKRTGEVHRQNINIDQYGGTYEDAGLESPDISVTPDQIQLPQEHFISDSFVKVTTVSQFGARKLSFITDYEPGSKDAELYGGGTIIKHFIRNIRYSANPRAGTRPRVKPHSDWSLWTAQQGILTFDKPTIMFQCLSFIMNGNPAKDANGNPMVDSNGSPMPLFCLVALDNRSAQTNLLNALVTPTNRALPLDGKTNNPYGGIAEADGVLVYFVPGKDTEGRNTLRVQPNKNPKTWAPEPYPLTEEQCRGLFIPWSDLLHFMTADEQCAVLAAEFGADTVNYVISNEPALARYTIPEKIAHVGIGKYASLGASMGGGSIDLTGHAPAYAPPPPAYAPPPPAATPQQAPPSGLPTAPGEAPVGLAGLAKEHRPKAQEDAMEKLRASGVKIAEPNTGEPRKDLTQMAASLTALDLGPSEEQEEEDDSNPFF